MPVYVAREAPKVSVALRRCFCILYFCFSFMFMIVLIDVKLWRKICAEASIEVSLLAENWKFVLAGLVFQVPLFYCRYGFPYFRISVADIIAFRVCLCFDRCFWTSHDNISLVVCVVNS